MDGFGGGHEDCQRFAFATEFEFLGCKLFLQLGHFFEELLPIEEFLAFLFVGFDLIVGHGGALLIGEFGQVDAFPVIGGDVVELEHPGAEIDGNRLKAFSAFLQQFADDALEALEHRFVGFGDARGGKEPVVIAVLGIGARHGVVQLTEDVYYLVFFELVSADLCQQVGDLFVFHCCDSFVLGKVCEWPLIARASHT